MRQILFRGKRVDNGEWCYGVPLVEGWSTTTYIASYEYSSLAFVQQIEVVPETLGQFTGLTDKNGKRIFEGDIVSYTEEIETRSRGKETLKGVYEVKFEYCGFSPLDCLACTHLEIIGNIHDNGELLTAERSDNENQ